MQELDDSERALIALARRGLTPTADDSARVLARVERALAASAGTHEGARHAPADIAGTTVLRASVGHWARRALLACSIAGASGVVGYRLGLEEGQKRPPATATTRQEAPAPAETRDRAEGQPAPAAAREPLAPAVVKTTNASTRRLPSSPPIEAKAPPATEAGSLQREIAALREAERALRESEPGRALELLDALDRELPDGKLLEERSAAASVARCALGLGSRRALREAFVRSYPDSMYRERVEQGCAAR